MRQNCQPMSLLPGAVLRYGVIGCIGRSALEPWQLGAGHTVPVKATRQYKALFTQKNKELLRTRTASLQSLLGMTSLLICRASKGCMMELTLAQGAG